MEFDADSVVKRAIIRLARGALLTAAICLLSTNAIAEKRVALVIGNSSYAYIPGLANPVNDAEAIAEKLWMAGFEVIEVIDADLTQMQVGLATFANRLAPGDDAIFYFSGHGVRVGQSNFLLPVSVHPTTLEDLVKQSVAAQDVVDLMDAANVRLRIVILDSCRNNPFTDLDEASAAAIIDRTLKVKGSVAPEQDRSAFSRSVKDGLAELSSSGGETLIAFATAPGSVAYDGEGSHSPFTQALLQHINEPGLEIGDVLRRVRADVRTSTAGRQVPWTTSTLENSFFFRVAVDQLRSATTGMTRATNTLGGLPPRRVIDAAFWRTIADSSNPDYFVAYLKLLPRGLHAAEARERLAGWGRAAPDEAFDFLPDLDPPALVSLAKEKDDPSRASVPVVPSGVGPVSLEPMKSEGKSGRWVFVAEPPSLGYARFTDSEALERSTVAWVSGDLQLGYEPIVGSNGGDDLISVDVLNQDGTKQTIDQRVIAWVHACDLLAGMPHDTRRVTAGMRQHLVDLNYDAAIAVCEIAVKDHPDVPRFWAQLARAYRSAGRYEEARDWYQKAADSGYMAAVINFGQMNMDGQALVKDLTKARELFDLAAAANEPRAYTALASIYRYGIGVPKDFKQALAWQRKGAEEGVDWAMFNIGEHYQLGLGEEKDLAEAVKWFTRAATSGELTAQYRLARMYLRGDEIPQDLARARHWFETAAGQGLPNAFTRLGVMYERGQGVKSDLDVALRYYTHAVRSGDSEALMRLGRFYANGKGLERDTSVAARLFKMATAAGVVGMERDFAKLYEAGDGVAQDLHEALRLYQIAADRNPWAARDVARLYTAADGIGQDFVQAAQWYERAARGGVHLAALDLARLYQEGRGVTKDPVQAVLWAALALRAKPDDEYVRGKVEELVNSAETTHRIMATQIFLTRHGYSVGPIDGVAGAKSKTALRDLAAKSDRPIGDTTVIDVALLAAIAILEQE